MALQQRKYMKKSRRNLYIALEELGRHQLEIAALIMDQADKNNIKSRPMGLGL